MYLCPIGRPIGTHGVSFYSKWQTSRQPVVDVEGLAEGDLGVGDVDAGAVGEEGAEGGEEGLKRKRLVGNMYKLMVCIK